MRKKNHRRERRRQKQKSIQSSSSSAKTSKPWRPLPIVAGIILGLVSVFILNRSDLVEKLETAWLDTQMRQDTPSKESEVVIVEITQEDFESELFDGQATPLNQGGLHRLITAVSGGKPCVIGVDIDTSFKEFADFRVLPIWSPVIWARESEKIPLNVNEKPALLDVLGGQARYNADSGIPFLIDKGGSGITRRYKRLIETVEGNQPSFAYAVYKKAAEQKCRGMKFPELEAHTSPLSIRYSRNTNEENAGNSGRVNDAIQNWEKAGSRGRYKIPASHIVKLSESADWQDNNLIKNKIVLIGGTYLGNDKHATPFGEMSGLETNANVIETELSGGGFKAPNTFVTTVLSLFDGFLIIVLFQALPLSRAFWCSLPLIILLSMICSYFTDYSWLFFMPVMLGVMIAEFIDKIKDRWKENFKGLFKKIFPKSHWLSPDEK